jgi:hypothetical protein
MAKSKASGADARPSDDEISARAYELFLQRGSVPGHENDDWLQAEAELIEARRSAQAAFGGTVDQSASQPASQPSTTDADSGEGRKANSRRDGTSGRRTLRQ